MKQSIKSCRPANPTGPIVLRFDHHSYHLVVGGGGGGRGRGHGNGLERIVYVLSQWFYYQFTLIGAGNALFEVLFLAFIMFYIVLSILDPDPISKATIKVVFS